MEFNELIKGLGEKLGLDLPLQENTCALSVDDMQIALQALDEVVMLSIYGEIGEPPPQGLEQLLTAMLNANHLFQGTAGATISRDPESGRFFLFRCEPLSVLTIERLMEDLEKFANVLETWRKLLADYRPSEPAADASLTAEPLPFGGSGFMTV